jgi:ATP-dependent Clp protease ATP-binding subunit ClpA
MKRPDPEMIERLRGLDSFLSARILGQDEVISEITRLLQRTFCGIRLPNRPIASMLFLGPTGVGKTETAGLLTEQLFGTREKLIRLDMSEYMTVDSIDILRGENVEEEGVLGLYHERTGGTGTILFDEIEKAHRLILDLLLQILSAARFTTASGRTLDLSGYVVVATSNIGSEMLMESRTRDRETLVRRTIQAATQDMRPEIYARFDKVCVFNRLIDDVVIEIARLHLDGCLKVVRELGHDVTLGPGVLDYVLREGWSEQFGARPLQQAALDALGDAVVARFLENKGDPVQGNVEYDRRRNRCELTITVPVSPDLGSRQVVRQAKVLKSAGI